MAVGFGPGWRHSPPRPCEASAGRPDSLGKWTGMRVLRPLLRFGRPACVSQHLCPEMESRAGIAPAFAVLQTAACAARPTGRKLKARASAFALARVVCQLRCVLESSFNCG